jgi:hypothetical protein
MMTPILAYGSAEPLIVSTNMRRMRDGLDTGTIQVLSAGEFDYAPGSQPPRYGGLEIDDVSTERDGADFLHSLSCYGILAPKPQRRERGYPKIRKTLEGWDEASDSWITTEPDDFEPGAALVGHATMFIVESSPEHLHGSYYRVSLNARGLAWSKPVKRVIRCNEQIVSPSEPIIVNLDGGWEDARRGAVSLPKVVVIDSYVTNSAAPTDSIPGNATPPDAPDVLNLEVTGPDLVYQWPNNWKLADVSSDELGETGYRLLTLTYEFVYEATF